MGAMSEQTSTYRIPPPSQKHEKMRYPTSVSISQEADGSQVVTQGAFVDECRCCRVAWPCLPAQVEIARAALARAEEQAARLASAGDRMAEHGGRLFDLTQTTEDIWLDAAGAHEIACLGCGCQAIGNRSEPAVIEHLDTCDVTVWLDALAAYRAARGGEA